MSLTAAASGFVVFLLSVSAIQGRDDYGVTYSSTEICAVKGSTVDISCTYTYPSIIRSSYTTVEKAFWFAKMNGNVYVDLKTDPVYSDRVQYKGVDKDCTLRITDLRESDSAEYKFRFTTNQEKGKHTGSPGVTLSVTEPPTVQVHQSRSPTYLECVSSYGRNSFIWFKNGEKIHEKYRYYYPGDVGHADKYTCAVRGCEKFPSPPVYAPRLPSVSVSPSAEIVEGSSVTLTCSSDANPAAKYTWYKENQNWHLQAPSEDPKLYFSSIQSSDSRKYHCTAENKLGRRTSENISIDVKYAPKLPSVSVSPSAEIVEGSSVNLTCSSDANPAAKYTWYKEKQELLRGPEGVYLFSSISSEDRGIYSCKSENQYGEIMSSSVSVDVQYAPRLPSVSVSPSAEIVEGSSVTLTCSSDANPAAKYTWYKENEDSPKSSGQIFTITDFRAEHSGNYYCEAQNRRGRNKTTVHLTVAGSGKSVAAGTITAVLLAVISLFVFLWIRKKRTSRESTEAEERPDDREQGQPEEQDDFQSASVHFSNNQEDNLYSNIRPAQPQRHVEQQEVVYAAVTFNSASTAPRARGQGAAEDPAALYSTINKTR